MSKTERILTFIDVIEYKCIVKAAEERSVTKAAISKQISLFESECGIQLIDHSKGEIIPTQAGLELFEKTKRLKSHMNDIQSIFNDYKTTPQGNLKVFSDINFAKYCIFPRLKYWFETYPLINLNLDVREQIPNIEKESYDIIMGGMQHPELKSSIQITLEKDRYYLCASPGYIKQFGHLKKLEDLHHHRYLAHFVRKPNSKFQVINVGNNEIVLEPFFCLNSFLGLVQLAIEGVGIIWVSGKALGNHLVNGDLIELLPDLSKDSCVPNYLYYKESKHVPPKIRAFIQFVKECVVNLQAD